MGELKHMLFLVELSEKSEESLSAEGFEDFCFCYSVRIPADLVGLTKSGKQSVFYLEREVLRDLYFDCSRIEYQESVLEILRAQVAIGPMVFLATWDILDEVIDALCLDPELRDASVYYHRDSGRKHLETYYVGIPLVPDTCSGPYTERYRVRFAAKVQRESETVPH